MHVKDFGILLKTITLYNGFRKEEVMNQRSKEILNLLIERKESRLSDLASLYEVSDRTIRNDVVSLNDYLGNLNFGQIKIKNKHLRLHLTVDKKRILTEINKFDVYEYKFTSDERSLICLLMLINNTSYMTIQQLSEKLLTSRSTVVNDLRTTRSLAKEHGIKLVSRANKGFKVEADEVVVRRFLYQVTGLEHFSILETVAFEEGYEEKIQLDMIELALKKCRTKLALTEKNMARLQRYLTISAFRNYHGQKLEKEGGTLTRTYQYLADSLISYLFLDEVDIIFIEKELEQDVSRGQLSSKINKESIRIQVVAMRFIEKISQELQIDFKEDYIFYDNFAAHLLRMLRREDHASHSPLFMEDIVKSNLKIKDAILHHLGIIEESIGRKARLIEIDYIIIHVYAAMERKKRKGSSLKVALVTQEKATEIFLIESKLNNNFSFNLDIYSVADTIQGYYDLVLTTTYLPNQEYLHISPVVTDEDYILIANEIDRIIKEKEFSDISLQKDTALKIIELISEKIDQEELTKKELKASVRTLLLSFVEDSEEIVEQRLADFLPETHIQLDVEVADWKEAIYRAGQNLVVEGSCDITYLDTIVKNIQENGPYMVISEGFAYPHAQIGDYNRKTAMNLIRLKHPVYFDDEVQDDVTDIGTLPVRYICLLSAVDSRTHTKAFFNLSNLLKNPRFKEKLDACQTSMEVHALIEEYEILLDIRR